MKLPFGRLFFVLPRSFLSLLLILLAACSFDNSGTSLFDDPVSIESIKSENLAPANWTFRAKTDLLLSSYQWSFSDGSIASESNQTAEVSHTFQEPGLYSVRLDYVQNNGQSGHAETQVIVRGGIISGRILAAADNLVDIDTRETYQASGDNNSFGNAQVISTNTRLSGIVDSNDAVDYYQVQLQKSQRLMVQLADPDSNTGSYDLVTLSLYTSDTDDAPITETTEVDSGRFNSALVVPKSGSYFIKIEAESPAPKNSLNTVDHGIYSLSVETASANSNAEFALDEVNVLLKPNRQYSAQGLRTKTDLGRFKTLTLEDARSFMGSANIRYASAGQTFSNQYQQQRWEVLQAVEILSQHDDIEIAEPNWKRYPLASPAVNDPLYSSQWHYDTINLPQAWQALDTSRGDGFVVAVLDTGILIGHPDLSNNLMGGYDFVDNDTDANDPGDKSINGQRSSFHGTHVAGTIAASANSIGGVGIAPEVKIMPVRVLGEGGGFSSDIIAGVCFAAKLQASAQAGCDNAEVAAKAADIINLSLGGPGYSQIEQNVYSSVMDKGIIVIAAAGNESTSEPFYPATYDRVISVSALSQSLEQASYSNFGSTIDVAAPGGDFSKDSGIMSTLGDDSTGTTEFTYGSLQGTSMAAPHVAGVAVLMKSVKPSLTHAEFLGYLNAGNLTQDLGVSGRDDVFGHGLINAEKAVLAVQGPAVDKLISSNNQLFFNIGVNALSFVLTATNDLKEEDAGVLSVKSVKYADNQNVSWLSLATVAWGENTVTVDRTELVEGRHQADIVINSTTLGDLTIRVTLQVGNPAISANAGVQYVLLIDADAKPDANGILPTVAGSAPLVANKGEYIYQITEIKKGRYLVSTGSDLDFDNVICDAGESCGQYPTLEQPKIITISEDTPFLELDMSVNYSFASNLAQGQAFQNSADSVKPKPIAKTVKNKEIDSENWAPLKAKADY